MSDHELTNAEKFNKLPWSIATNALINAFLQLTFLGSVFVLFLDTLGLSKTEIGFLLSLLPYTGLLALFMAPLVARFGYKRTFNTFNVIRAGVAACLLLTPWVVSNFGPALTLTFITVIVAVFSIARTLVITAYYPWAQEYIPASIQGRYSASNNLFITLAGFVAMILAGFMLDLLTGLSGFITLIVLGLVLGVISIWTTLAIPGGAPLQTGQSVGQALVATVAALRDKGLTFFLIGLGLITLATTPLTSFVPLFMQEEAGLSSGNVVLIQTGILLGGLVSTYLWGWSADRYGSRPIMLSGICLYALLPLLWMVMPRDSQVSLYVGLAIAFLHGVADMGWIIGSTRLLYVSIVPPEHRSEYTALYYACVGLFGGTSQLLAGQIVETSAGLSGRLLFFSFDAYSGLFGLSVALALASLFVLRRVRSDTKVSVEAFAGMFVQGNPFTALTSLIGYHFAKDEASLVAITERLGETRSPFTVDELLEVLADPRFNVRFEAIISIARTRRDPRLTQALIDVFDGTELALSNMAAWALGRRGDPAAIPVLRRGLASPYHSIQANSARALGRLKDRDIAPLLIERLSAETDKGLQMAFASTLGNLGASQAAPLLLDLLSTFQNEGARRELALSLARLVGEEGRFIHLARQARADLGTAGAQAVAAFRRKIRKEQIATASLLSLLERCADSLARNDFAQGAEELGQIIDRLPKEGYVEHCRLILASCKPRLAGAGAGQNEHLLLALHTLDTGWQPSD